MKREELKINDKVIVIMEQPAGFVLGLERQFTDTEVVGYCKKVLAYPAGINPELDEIISIPHKLVYGDLQLDVAKEGKVNLYLVEKLFFAMKERKSNAAYLGEYFVKLCEKKIDEFKYRELVEIGTEIFKQISEFAYLIEIREFFRNM